MAKRKTLKDDSGNIVYPTTKAGVVYMSDNSTTAEQAINAKPNIIVTNTDPGEGEPLAANNFIAVYGEIVDLFYPVGSIYMSATLSTVADVHAALGGTWVVWGSGRVPVGVDTAQTEFDTVEETGGEKTHTLTIDEMQHTNYSNRATNVTTPGGNWGVNAEKTGHVAECTATAHNNLQPYITCYMYKRVA